MNPKENSVARFTNITDHAWSHPFGGVPYAFEAGESRLMPFPVVEHLAKHLAMHIFITGDRSAQTYDGSDATQGSGAPLWNEESLAKLQATIISETFDMEKPKVKTEMELMQEQIDKLNASIGLKEDVVEPLTPEAPLTPPLTAEGFKDKSEVIAELQKRNIPFDARGSKATLEKLLEPKA